MIFYLTHALLPMPTCYLRPQGPLLQKYPDTTILHVDTNNCVNESSCVALDKILMLKAFIQNSPPQCKIMISNVINRVDNGKPSLTVENLNNHLNFHKLHIVDNSNTGKECLGKKGLHHSERRSDKLATNFINKIRSL